MRLFSHVLGTLCAAAMTMCLFQPASVSAANKTGVVTADSLNVRTGAGTNNSIITSISEGTKVTVKGSATDSSGQKWYKITAGSTEGYVSSWYIDIVSSDSGSSSASTETKTETKSTTTASTGMSDKEFESYMKSQGFPESYKPMLRELHKDHPNWIFMAQKTGLDWNYVL